MIYKSQFLIQEQPQPSDRVEISKPYIPVTPEAEEELKGQSFTDFLFMLKRSQGEIMDEDAVAAVDSDIDTMQGENRGPQQMRTNTEEVAQRRQQTTEYQQLLADFSRLEGDEKVLLLQKLRLLAPEAGIDEELLTLLQLATYDPDMKVEKIAREMLRDLANFRDGKISPMQQLVAQLSEMNSGPKREEKQAAEIDTGGDEITQQKDEKIAALKALVLNTENSDEKGFLLNALMQFDQDSALDVIQHQLLNSKNSDERFKAVERLRSSIGDYDSSKIREILETVRYDYDKVVAENAQLTLTMLDEYMKNSENRGQE